jgi:hypothetical protein
MALAGRDANRSGLAASLRSIDWERQLRDPSGDTALLSFSSGLLLGAFVGVVVALLLAPRPGRETREQVWHTGIELRARARSGGDHDETLADRAEQAEVELLRRMTAPEQA